ncbi:TetR family transcriptional regulator [Saccharomonospora sp. CUA-673]|uniref:TetR/AcrR family transcriptional regulator n=1 Tax=Saccharomonospora sp. CUA-673 TaxID=1904969 RepID=UPI00095EFBB8|nr:TetR/AcrR family transcriptional regulator [Saccharomonospora sp. CUA-673]OLT46679.1 TetR family transcriptional regulator [Saccharomonospora sp. CUA-673]
MPAGDISSQETQARGRRVDARRNERTLLDAAARVFADQGVDAPVRQIATEAGVGVGTVYRHFPQRSDLVIAVYRHQVDACVELGERLLDGDSAPLAALEEWVDAFVDFLVTKHGLAAVSGTESDEGGLHAYFLDQLLPVCERLLAAARDAGDISAGIGAYELMRGIGNLCLFGGDETRYDARKLAHLLLAGAVSISKRH